VFGQKGRPHPTSRHPFVSCFCRRLFVPWCSLQVFTFAHPNPAPVIDNRRYTKLVFPITPDAGSATVHGEMAAYESTPNGNQHSCHIRACTFEDALFNAQARTKFFRRSMSACAGCIYTRLRGCLVLTACSLLLSVLMPGFAGYFDAVLYKDVHLGIEPATHTPDMFSW
jgi:hypothetical protein